MKILLLAIATCLLAPPAFPADPPAKAEEKGKLVTRVFRVPAFIYSFPSEGTGIPGFDENGATPAKRTRTLLPPASDGTERYDVWEYLMANGVEKVPGSEAIQLSPENATVVTTSPEQMDLVGRIFIHSEVDWVIKHAEITATLWQFEAPQPVGDIRPPTRLEDIRERAGDSLRLIDQLTIKCKSGWRAFTANRQVARDAKPSPPAAVQPKEEVNSVKPPILGEDHGSVLVAEPVLGPDGVTVDIVIKYQARLRIGKAMEETMIDTDSAPSLRDGTDTVISLSQVRDAEAAGRWRKVALELHRAAAAKLYPAQKVNEGATL